MKKTTTITNSRLFSSFSDPYNHLLQALREPPQSLSHLKQLHALIISNGLPSKSVLACRLIAHYAHLSGPTSARKVFDHLPNRTSHAYNYMFGAYLGCGKFESALELYGYLCSTREASPGAVGLSRVFSACIGLRSVGVGKIVHGRVLRSGSELDLRLVTDIVRFYLRCGLVSDGKKVFDSVSQKDAVVWTVMIDGYFCNGCFDEGLELFLEMRGSGLRASAATWNVVILGFARNNVMTDALAQFRLMQLDGVRPDEVSLVVILPLISQAALLKPGLEAHGYVVRNGFELELFVVSALVDMYAKCGKLASARFLFDRAQSRDIGLWNIMIVGYGMHGDCWEVFKLFNQMTNSGVVPNVITFTSILSACSHAGLVSEGMQMFDLMRFRYGLIPSPEHHACIVDMLGRAGELDEAFEFIKKMPLHPGMIDVWGALLSACKTYHNVGLAEIAVQNILDCKKNGEESGYHVMMANIYADVGKWEEVAKVRSQMRGMELHKRTGCSWIEIGGNVYNFDRGDRSHPQSDAIYAMIRHLESSMFSKLH